NNQPEPGLGTLQIFELAAPGDVIAGRKLDLRGDHSLRVSNIAAEVPVTEIDIDVAGELRVLGANDRRPRRKTYLCHLSQRDSAAAVQRDENLGCDRLRIAAIVPRIADAHSIAFAAFDCGRYRLGAKPHGDEILQVAHHEAVARKLRAIGIDV